MDIEIDLRLQRNILRLKRFERFNWKFYFLKTFGFLFLLNLIIFATIPRNLSSSALLTQFALSLWIIILVCKIFTPIITYWYHSRQKKVVTEILHLTKLKQDMLINDSEEKQKKNE